MSFLSWGCATLENMRLKVDVNDVSPDAGKHAKTPPDEIIVYAAKRFAPKNYEILARLSTNTNYSCETQDDLFNLFRNKASELGANAVVVTDVQQTGEVVHILYGYQPRNDLGYAHASSDESIAEITPTPVSTGQKPRFVGQAYAIRTSP
jgi:hypothetical protein